MLFRSAYWIGQPVAGQEASFRSLVVDELVPAMRGFPGVSSVQSLWPERMEDDPPAIHCQVLVEFADAEAKAAMMACPERTALRPRVVAAAALFDGRLSHIDFTVGRAAPIA